MNSPTSDELNILLAEYTLGVLDKDAEARIQALLAQDRSAAQRAIQWETLFLQLVDLLPAEPLDPDLYRDICLRLDLPAPPSPQARPGASHASVTATRVASPADNGTTRTDHASARPAGAGTPVANNTGTHPADNDIARTRHTPANPADNDIARTSHTPANPADNDIARTSHRPARPADKSAIRAEAAAPTDSAGSPGIGTEYGSQHSKERRERSRQETGRQPLRWLRTALFAGSIVALAGLLVWTRTPAEPPVTIVNVTPVMGAVLQAPGQSSSPGWVVTLDAAGNARMQPLVRTDIPENASVQLWTYTESDTRPRSLGLIDPNLPVAVPATLMGPLNELPFFEMTLEATNGSPTGQPEGPILFMGQTVSFGQPEPETPAQP